MLEADSFQGLNVEAFDVTQISFVTGEDDGTKKIILLGGSERRKNYHPPGMTPSGLETGAKVAGWNDGEGGRVSEEDSCGQNHCGPLDSITRAWGYKSKCGGCLANVSGIKECRVGSSLSVM